MAGPGQLWSGWWRRPATSDAEKALRESRPYSGRPGVPRHAWPLAVR
jgi:hypothetical protein